MINRIRNYFAWRKERRIRYQRAVKNAQLMVIGGTVHGFSKSTLKKG
jgi:hypothetical protein